jgi:hypothetical protein
MSIGTSGRLWASPGTSGRPWAQLGSPGHTWAHLDAPGLPWAHFSSSQKEATVNFDDIGLIDLYFKIFDNLH